MSFEKGIRDIGLVINQVVSRCNYANRFGYYSVAPGEDDTIEIQVCGKNIWLELIKEFGPSVGNKPRSGSRVEFRFSGIDIGMEWLRGQEDALFMINDSLADVRSEPCGKAELVTQAILGDEARVFTENSGWSLVRLDDGYTGWVESGNLSGISRRDAEEWKIEVNAMIAEQISKFYNLPDTESGPSGELLAGTLVRVVNAGERFSKIALPGGEHFFVQNEDLEGIPSGRPDSAGLVGRGRCFIGIPYLWGGTTPRGFDCSGLVKRLYQMEGIQLPRDSDLQAEAGEQISLEEALGSGGTLLFFSEGGERIDHVAVSTGEEGFIHSSGRVRPGSMSSKAESYDRKLADSFCRAVKILE